METCWISNNVWSTSAEFTIATSSRIRLYRILYQILKSFNRVLFFNENFCYLLSFMFDYLSFRGMFQARTRVYQSNNIQTEVVKARIIIQRENKRCSNDNLSIFFNSKIYHSLWLILFALMHVMHESGEYYYSEIE